MIILPRSIKLDEGQIDAGKSAFEIAISKCQHVTRTRYGRSGNAGAADTPLPITSVCVRARRAVGQVGKRASAGCRIAGVGGARTGIVTGRGRARETRTQGTNLGTIAQIPV